jgi:regulator of PEP synthase PpsR (kinase-PPPase family)
LHKDYFERVDAITFTVNHDDGMNLKDLKLADIVLTGVSRCGKTPLSIYLSVLGWKVANVPLVQGISAPKELYEIDRRRVFGLSIEYEQLLKYRKEREKSLGVGGASLYAKPKMVFAEIEEAIKIFKKGGFSIIPITNKPLESSADEIIKTISVRFPAYKKL